MWCRMRRREVGGWGRDPKKCTGRDWGMGSSTISWKLRPVVKYHLRRGVGFMKFLENGSRPQPPTSQCYIRLHLTFTHPTLRLCEMRRFATIRDVAVGLSTIREVQLTSLNATREILVHLTLRLCEMRRYFRLHFTFASASSSRLNIHNVVRHLSLRSSIRLLWSHLLVQRFVQRPFV